MSLLPVYPRLDLDLERAEGCWLYDRSGRRVLDCYGGHAVTPLGHGHPELAKTLAEGFATLDFYSNSVRMAVQDVAAKAVLGDSAHLAYAHFVNSGTEANEAAIHLARTVTGRTKVLSFDVGFHGRTLASLGATRLPGYAARRRVPEDPSLHDTLTYADGAALASIDESTAAVLAESLPSLGGILPPPEGYYPALAARCREVGALLIFDEVQGGVGRLGSWFAHSRYGVEPDMVTLAKSLAGGFPAGALLVRREYGEAIAPGELGSTFGGGPLACRMIARTAELIREGGLMDRVGAIFERFAALAVESTVDDIDVRGAGALIGIQTPYPAKALRDALLARDVIVGTSAQPQTVRLMPPYVITDDQLDVAVDAIRDALEELSRA